LRPFELVEPESLDAAISTLAERPEAKLIAGGTALLIMLKQGVYMPSTLVNLAKVSNASEVTFDPVTGLRIGALARIYDVERHPYVREHYPMLAATCHVVANIRIRNMATIGGNLAHADYQSDPPAALVALGARVELQGPHGLREVPLAKFIIGAYETSLLPAEIVRAILIPTPEPGWHGAYIKFTTRSSEDRPAAGAAAMVRTVDGRCADVRLVIGAVTSVPLAVHTVADQLRDRFVTPQLLAEVAPLVEAAVDPIDDLRGSAAYKRRIAGVVAERAIRQCLAGAGVDSGPIQ
jgi:carbon-monoxide dehydrogenase medium subunit